MFWPIDHAVPMAFVARAGVMIGTYTALTSSVTTRALPTTILHVAEWSRSMFVCELHRGFPPSNEVATGIFWRMNVSKRIYSYAAAYTILFTEIALFRIMSFDMCTTTVTTLCWYTGALVRMKTFVHTKICLESWSFAHQIIPKI
jgi:hypothetical protein